MNQQLERELVKAKHIKQDRYFTQNIQLLN